MSVKFPHLKNLKMERENPFGNEVDLIFCARGGQCERGVDRR